MGGLAVLLSIALYLVAAYWAIKMTKASRFKWVVVAVAVLLPTADAIVGRVYLKYLCAKEGGLKVYRVAQHVEGFFDDRAVTEYWARELGYRFIEGESHSGRYFRYTRIDGKFIRDENISPISKYRVRSIHIGDTRDIYMRYEYLVDDIRSAEVLAADTEIGFNGGWAERFLAEFSDAGGGGVAWCGSEYPEIRRKALILSSLKR